MVKKILSYLGEFKKDTILTPVFMIGEVVMEMIIPFLMASMIDKGVEAGNMKHIVFIGIIMLCLAGVGYVSGYFGAVYGAKASTGLAKNLRGALFNKIQTFSFSNIDRFSTASLVTRLTTDVNNVQQAAHSILRMAVRSPFSMIIAMVMAFLISPKLASIYLIAVVGLGLVVFLIVRTAMGYFKQAFPKYDALNESIQENITGIRVVKSYVREDYEIEKFNRASRAIYKVFTKAEGRAVLNAPAMNVAIGFCVITISWIGAKMIVQNTLTTGQLMSLLAYCINILASLMMLSMTFIMIIMSEASAERIVEVLNEEPDITNPENPVYEVKDGSIKFDNVLFSYHKSSEEPVLKDIDLDIKSGETVGIIGGTGSAKTSLINMISRLYDVDQGAVYVGGEDVRSYDLDTLRNSVAVVLQKNELFSGTILENLRWGDPNATLEDCERVCKLACADEFIEKMPAKYNTYIEQGGSNVSGGQKQRLCIARALLKKPRILILDDSTSAVDTATDAKIRRAFKEEIPDITKIIIAQRISSVQDADKIIVMNEGKVDSVGTHEELMALDGIYKEVYESQNSGSGDFDEVGGDQ